MIATRRRFLSTLMALGCSAGARRGNAHNDAGVVDPALLVPELALTLDDGRKSQLRSLLAGHVSAVQLMFTHCTAICPIQGALFASAAQKLGDSVRSAQWLSLTIDPSEDDPAALRAWMARFGAHPRWRAARPVATQLNTLLEFLKSRNPQPDPHTAQVYFFDKKARLVLRSVDFPAVEEILHLMHAIDLKA